MTTVTSLTADRMLAIEAASVVDGDVIGGNLILTKHDGSQINAGPVTGPQGPQGPVGSDLAVLNAIPVLDVGLVNQIRAGRQLGPADFGNIGLSAPIGLWNLSDLSDVSGNGRNLFNKGAVPFAAGINGVATTAAQFVGSTAQALYIPDTGVNDPFRIKTGSFGCWFRAAKRGVGQYVMTKHRDPPLLSWGLNIGTANVLASNCSIDGNAVASVIGVSDVCDDRWHFGIVTVDATTIRLYVDGVLEGTTAIVGSMFMSSAPLNVGSYAADGSTAAISPFFGRIDEVFVTADVLSEDQIRNLYCAKIPHTLAVVPSRLSLNVRRRKKGSGFAVADFPTQPLRLYNFSGGSLGDEGSNGVAVTSGGSVSVAGADGSLGNAYNFNGAQSLTATDAGLPSGLATRSYGCWFKTAVSTSSSDALLSWGTWSSGDLRLRVAAGTLACNSVSDAIAGGIFVADGVWHFAVGVEDNGAIDGVKRKLYCDGRLVGISPNLPALVLAGANSFRIGATPIGTLPFIGQIDGAFVCDYALTPERIAILYAKGSQALAPSPKSVGQHVEAMDAASLLATFDTLESQYQIDLKVAA